MESIIFTKATHLYILIIHTFCSCGSFMGSRVVVICGGSKEISVCTSSSRKYVMKRKPINEMSIMIRFHIFNVISPIIMM